MKVEHLLVMASLGVYLVYHVYHVYNVYTLTPATYKRPVLHSHQELPRDREFGDDSALVSLGRGTGSDTISGDTGGSDTISGDTGRSDTISGDTGRSDTISGDTGRSDTISGDTGRSDTISVDTGRSDTISGDTGSDTISGDTGRSGTISGDTGSDTISGDTGSSDTISGDTGSSDTISGDTGRSDTISGDTYRSDTISGDTYRSDTISGDTGRNDTISGDTGRNDTISGDTGRNDTISGDTGRSDNISGDTGIDTISGDTGSSDTISGDTGSSDTISGDTGSSDTISGDTGSSDTISGDTGSSDTISGDTGRSDTISGDTYRSDTICGDTYRSDTISGDTGRSDTISGDTGRSDTISGDTYRSDTISGDTYRSDTISGDTYRSDTISGDTGSDTISGDTYRSDTISGGDIEKGVSSSNGEAGNVTKSYDMIKMTPNSNHEDMNLTHSNVNKGECLPQETATPSCDLNTASVVSVDHGVTWCHTSQPIDKHLTDQEPLAFIPDKPDTSPVGQPASIPKQFLIEEATYCQKRPDLQVIAYVHSAITNVKKRGDVRATWGNASNYDLGDISVMVGVVFMVGRAKNDLERHTVQEESRRYHDIVQGDYGDHYRLLTYKALASLYWINKHCSHVPWTLHADDDTHIDIFLYYRALQELDDVTRKQFICSHMNGPVLREGRWKVRYTEYPARDYPLYCSGGAWFLQTNLIPRLLEASKVVPFLWVDDAYITGILAKQTGIKQLGFQDYYGHAEVDLKVLGHQVVWFQKFAPRSVWWREIVNYHRKHSMHDPATLFPPKNNILNELGD